MARPSTFLLAANQTKTRPILPQRDKKLDLYECNICLDTAQDAVVSLCGHLYWYVWWALCLPCMDICTRMGEIVP
jgi:hypothetical protein